MSGFSAAGQVASPLLNGPVTAGVDESGLSLVGAAGEWRAGWADVLSVGLADYVVQVVTRSGTLSLSRFGRDTEALWGHVLEGYNAAVRKALFTSGAAVLSAVGDYAYRLADGRQFAGHGTVELFDRAVLVLPPNLDARRIPLAFATVSEADYGIRLRVGGDDYLLNKLGREFAPLLEGVRGAMKRLRDGAIASLREIDPSLDEATAGRVADVMPEGAAVPVGLLRSLAPSLVGALESRIASGRAGAAYAVFRELSGPDEICVGLKRAVQAFGDGLGKSEAVSMLQGLLGNLAAEAAPEAGGAPEQLLWIAAPSPDKRSCAVEFADDDSATFVYRVVGDWPAFVGQLNYALEAIGFAREAIRLSDAELLAPGKEHYRMAAERNPALALVRGALAGRVIHASEAGWRKNLTALWECADTVGNS
jgi:hypothetical protein